MSGLASLVLAFLGAFGEFDTTWTQRGLLIAAVVCFVFAAYRIWAGEHKKVKDLELWHYPVLCPVINEVQIHSSGSKNVITMFAEVRNLGAPSAAMRLEIAIIFPDQRVEKLIPTHLPGPIVLQQRDHAALLSEEDSLLKKTAAPIGKGAFVRGHLTFVSPYTHDELNVSGTQIVLYCWDIRDKVTAWLMPIRADEAGRKDIGPYYLPGMDMKLFGSVEEAMGLVPKSKRKRRKTKFVTKDRK